MRECGNAGMHNARMRECTNARMHGCADARMHGCTDARDAGTQPGSRGNAGMRECGNAEIRECTNARMQERSPAAGGLQECRNAGMQKCGNAEMRECTDARTHEGRKARRRDCRGSLFGLGSSFRLQLLDWAIGDGRWAKRKRLAESLRRAFQCSDSW